MIVKSFGKLQSVAPRRLSTPAPPAMQAYDAEWWEPNDEDLAAIYADDPNIRIPVDELMRNVAQLGLHVFRRVSDTDRERLTDHELARWLKNPNPSTTTYRLIEALLGDLGVFFKAAWLKVRYRDEENRNAIGLVRIPPPQIKPIGGLLIDHYLWTWPSGERVPLDASEVVFFTGYNPLNPLSGLSNLRTLRRIVSEDAAAAEHREYYWRNASRHEGVIERPKDAPKWTPAQKQSFREQWQARFASAANSGLVAVLEDGMAFKQAGFSPRESEFIQGAKSRREITAAQFHIPQPSVGILEHSTLNNVKELHKQLYQDSLGPTLEMVQQEIERQLVPECTDSKGIYVEFNIAAKLAGSFEEQASGLHTLIGRPIMTPNEGRARLNLPSIKDDPTADQIAPQQGGPSDATANPNEPDAPGEPAPKGTEDAESELTASVLNATRARQRTALMKHAPGERSTAFFAVIDRWNRELAADLTPILGADEANRVAIQANVELFTQLEALEVA